MNVCKEKVKDDVMLLNQHFFPVKKNLWILSVVSTQFWFQLFQERSVENNEPERVFWKLMEEKEIIFCGWESFVENAQRGRTNQSTLLSASFHSVFSIFSVSLLFSKSGLLYIFSLKKRPQRKTWWQFSFNTCLKLWMVDMNLLRRYWSLQKSLSNLCFSCHYVGAYTGKILQCYVFQQLPVDVLGRMVRLKFSVSL